MGGKAVAQGVHAKELAEGKKGHMAKLEREIAAKYGIDVEKYNANKLKEQGAEGGAAAFYKSKKFSFDPRDKDAVSPREAAEEFLKLKFGK